MFKSRVLFLVLFCITGSCTQPALGAEEDYEEFASVRSMGLDTSLVPVDLLKAAFSNEYNRHPHYYDPRDVQEFFNDASPSSALQFLIQRNLDWEEAYKLTCKTLRWRASRGIAGLSAADFPCDLFKLGFIFEEGTAYRQSPTGEIVNGNPVVWIRLGALGEVVGRRVSSKPVKVATFAYQTVKAAGKKIQSVKRRIRRSRKRTKSSRRARKERRAARRGILRDFTVKHDGTMRVVLNAIAWWLDDWRRKHPTGAQATLVLDFEDSDLAMSSWSMGEFLISLDDHFPNLFDQIIGFRFKPKLWSLKSPISMFNRIFKSKISSSKATDRKLKFVKHEPQMGDYMARVDSAGFSLLPKHVNGDCLGPIHEPPVGCQPDPAALVVPGGFELEGWLTIHQKFYDVCKPRLREQEVSVESQES